MSRELGALSLSTLTDQEKSDLADAMRPLYMGTDALIVLERIKANAYAAGLAARPTNSHIAIQRPRILTGPKHQTVDEATEAYLRESADRVETRQIWGSGVSALVAGVLTAVANAVGGHRS